MGVALFSYGPPPVEVSSFIRSFFIAKLLIIIEYREFFRNKKLSRAFFFVYLHFYFKNIEYKKTLFISYLFIRLWQNLFTLLAEKQLKVRLT